MPNIDTDKIKNMTNKKIGYELFKREEKIRMKKFKKVLVFVSIGTFFMMGTLTANAATGGELIDEIKDIITIKVNKDEKNSNCQKKDDGSFVCKIDKSVSGKEDLEIYMSEVGDEQMTSDYEK